MFIGLGEEEIDGALGSRRERGTLFFSHRLKVARDCLRQGIRVIRIEWTFEHEKAEVIKRNVG
jgi:hypothetical protein